MHRHIAIGETSSYRYIGIAPPLPKETTYTVLQMLHSHMLAWGEVDRTQVDEDTPPYTELFANAGHMIDAIGSDAVDMHTLDAARAIMQLVESTGDSIVLLTPIITTDFQNPLFGPKADETRQFLVEK